jgi:glycerophosphoryl diester phosphodiesterase
MKPLWISHRGYKADAVENTAAAFRAAVALGFGALETDLRLTRDGHIALHHDPTLERLGGRRDAIASLTRAELEGMEPRLTFFDEFIAEFEGCDWTFDIKAETAEGVIDALVAHVRRGGPSARKIAHSRYVAWRPAHEAHLRRVFPAASFYAQERECWRAGLAVVSGVPALGGIVPGRVYALPPRFGKRPLYRPAVVAAYHGRGAKLTAFLPETESEARQAVEAGFDEILTNGPIFA